MPFFVLACLALLIAPVWSTDCGTGGTLTFSETGLVNCTNVVGSLHVVSTNAINLTKLSSLETVSGDLMIYDNLQLTSLQGLGRLRSVVGTLTIYGNTELASLGPLAQLAFAGDIRIRENWLVNLDGLQGIRKVTNTLHVWANYQLTSLDGLGNATSISYLEIGQNELLTSIEAIRRIKSIDTLQLRENPMLSNLSGVDGVVDLNSVMLISNPELKSLQWFSNRVTLNSFYLEASQLVDLTDLQNLRTLNGDLQILSNPLLISLGGLSNISGSITMVEVVDNSLLTSFAGLSRVTNINYLSIRDNPLLLSVDGLEGVQSSLTVEIRGNPVLATLDGLRSLESTRALLIVGNPMLTSLDGLTSLSTIFSRIQITSPWNATYPNTQLTSICALCEISYTGGASLDEIPDFRTNTSFTGVNAWSEWEAAGKPCSVGPRLCNGTLLVSPPSPSATPTGSSKPSSCPSRPPFPGTAVCVNGQWFINITTGEPIGNTTVTGPIHIVGDLVIDNSSIIWFEVGNSSRPIIIIDGDLSLGGGIVVDVDTAQDEEFIPLYEVTGNISGSIDGVTLDVENPDKCTEYEGDVVTRGDTVGVLVTTVPTKGCGSSSSNSLVGLWALMAILVCCAIGVVCIVSIAFVLLKKSHNKSRRSKLHSKMGFSGYKGSTSAGVNSF